MDSKGCTPLDCWFRTEAGIRKSEGSPRAQHPRLLMEMRIFVLTVPESAKLWMESKCGGRENLYKKYLKMRKLHPVVAKPTRQEIDTKRRISPDPEADRDALSKVPPPLQPNNSSNTDITIRWGGRKMKGFIAASIGKWLDVAVRVKGSDTLERHYLVPKVDYSDEAAAWKGTEKGQSMALTSSPVSTLKWKKRDEITLVSWTFSYKDSNRWPIGYAIGYVNTDKKRIMQAWSRSVFGQKFKGVDEEITNWRRERGQGRLDIPTEQVPE
ncbi:hypothetical protein QBC43DRAFT_213976 [Cladorrhinum sp. PSN259]|nr:hypothetical protein QBC43DRAFT_213976 [Cladorrhinum sp. PSN259]